jgi:hypothetical protein
MIENGKFYLFRKAIDEILDFHLKRFFGLHIFKSEVKLNEDRNTSKIVILE